MNLLTYYENWKQKIDEKEGFVKMWSEGATSLLRGEWTMVEAKYHQDVAYELFTMQKVIKELQDKIVELEGKIK